MTSQTQSSRFSLSLRVAAVLTLALIAVFSVYVYSEKQIDRANERRYQSRLLADELRQSSDDLTRMARTYVLTGDPVYKQNYRDILDIRDGRKPRPVNYDGIYWDLANPEGKPPRPDSGTGVPLLEMMRKAGFSDDEFQKLTRAKANSESLTAIEFAAMALVESPGRNLDARRSMASQMLHDRQYHQAKADIMQPLNEFYELTDRRTQRAVVQAEQTATRLRIVYVLVGMALLWFLWRTYRHQRATLGGTVDEVYAHITRIGQGNFTQAFDVAPGMGNSVLGWLAQTQRQLNEIEEARRESDHKLRRLTRFYAALSECNQAIVRCTSEQALFAEICRAAVEHGGMKMAWIGLVDRPSHLVKPIQAYGEGVEHLKDLHISVDDENPAGRGPTGLSIRRNQPFWCQDYQADPITAPWHELGARFGWAASAALPLHRKGVLVGAFNVYADEVNAFDEQVQNLLVEMAADIDFALHNFDREAARAAAETRTAESETRLMLALKGSQDALWDWDLEHHKLYYSARWWHMLGYEIGALPVDAQLWRSFIHPEDLPGVERLLRDFLRSDGESFSVECRLKHRQGHYFPVLVRGFVLRDASGRAVRVSGTNMDLTERVRAQQKDAMRSFMLERLTSELPLDQILKDFVLRLEETLPGALCSVLLLDEEGLHLELGAAPHLPDFYNAAIGKMPIGPQAGSCGTSAFTGQRVVVADVASHPYWVDYKALAQRAGLASCWSEPILSGSNKVLGTFAIYRRAQGMPQAHELELIEMAAHLTAIAIERKDAEMQLQLAAKVFEQGSEAVIITDSQRRMVRVNQAFCRITGYSEAEALGRDPSMLASGRHDRDYYRDMWKTLQTEGQWQGEIWNRRKDGSVYPQWMSISVLRDRSGALANYVAIATDISKRKEDEAHIRLLADFDPLTGLPNRRLLQDRIDHALSHAHRHAEPLALMFLDLDRFKNVNDSLGHHMGDELLIQVAQRLKSVLREEDTVCRLGGDEFVLLCPGTDADGAAHVASKVLNLAAQRYQIGEHELAITCSIGIALYPSDGETLETLSMSADTAMYRAKQAGRNAFRFFTTEMQTHSARTLQLENALSRALELQQLHLVYQPQVSLRDGSVVGVEALLRWTHPTLGNIAPSEFIPVAEDSGLILPIGEWVLRTACQQMRAWQDAGLAVRQMAVNLSAVQFRHANLPDLVSQVLTDAGLAPQCLELELTEGVAMDDPLGAIEVMNNLYRRGVRMSIDDFGTGYSSLNYLKRFQVYKLKIDQSFVRDITDDPDDKAIVAAIIGLARSLGFRTIAEGVETEGQLAFLREQGCDEVQGYYFSRPVPAAEFESFVRQQEIRQQDGDPLSALMI